MSAEKEDNVKEDEEFDNLTFKNDDKLGREDFARNLTNLITQKSSTETESLVIALDSAWGTGKTRFLHMWKNLLRDEAGKNDIPKVNVLYYNAWENDDCDDAFLPLLYRLSELKVYGPDGNEEELKAKAIKFAKGVGIGLANAGIEIFGGPAAKCIQAAISKGKDATRTAKDPEFFDNYTTYLKKKKEFRKGLRDLIPPDEESSPNKSSKLILLIDELDRCRPTFAIETLEIAKHFFNCTDVVFVFALDMQQLSHSIATMYGQEMDSSGYLMRFFKINIKIPLSGKREYADYLIEKLDKGSFVYSYFSTKSAKGSILNIFDKLNLSLRDMNTIFDNFVHFYGFHGHKSGLCDVSARVVDMKLELYLYLMCLKYKYPKIYHMLLHVNYKVFTAATPDDFVDNKDKIVGQMSHNVIDGKYCDFSNNIRDFIFNMSIGGNQDRSTWKHLATTLLIGTYTQETCAEYIEKQIEMFNPSLTTPSNGKTTT
jgi:hypothetical protein